MQDVSGICGTTERVQPSLIMTTVEDITTETNPVEQLNRVNFCFSNILIEKKSLILNYLSESTHNKLFEIGDLLLILYLL